MRRDAVLSEYCRRNDWLKENDNQEEDLSDSEDIQDIVRFLTTLFLLS